MSKRFSLVEACSDALMKVWFPAKHEDESWLESEDGRSWKKISLEDAKVVIQAYNDFLNEKYRD